MRWSVATIRARCMRRIEAEPLNVWRDDRNVPSAGRHCEGDALAKCERVDVLCLAASVVR
jgi:hypothetical protein